MSFKVPEDCRMIRGPMASDSTIGNNGHNSVHSSSSTITTAIRIQIGAQSDSSCRVGLVLTESEVSIKYDHTATSAKTGATSISTLNLNGRTEFNLVSREPIGCLNVYVPAATTRQTRG